METNTIMALGLTYAERIALGTRLLETITGDEAVRQVLFHAKWTMDTYEREQAHSKALCPIGAFSNAEVIRSAAVSARIVLPALKILHERALAEQARVFADRTEIDRRHAENPKIWQSYEKEAARQERLVAYQLEQLNLAARIAGAVPPESTAVAAAVLGDQPQKAG